ncbi:helix-turn-helix transcriptional regulator [Rhodococcus kronopolitis]|uniref:LuxR C-terminal-related transcriptional regulator n=1 Tax=Rhodococcus kronopolitis TaxID=1460226 RepID=A0ABV9FUH7_9NOCA
MVVAWSTMNRDAQLRTVLSALRGRRGPWGAVLTGAAGVGKTTLARRAVGAFAPQSRWTAGTESARSVPLGAFAHVVEIDTPRDPASVLRAARVRLAELGPDIVIGVDDAHLLDKLSATFVHQLAVNRVAPLVVTVRTGEPVPDAVTALWKDGLLTHVELAPFTLDETRKLVESALDGPVEESSIARIYTMSEGNPLFLRHLVGGAVEAERLRQVAGVWQLRGETVVNQHLSALIESRIELLDPALRHVLELLAFQEPLSLEVLTTLSDPESVEAAENAGLIRVRLRDDTGLTVKIAHPLYGEVVRAGTGVLAARRLRGELARQIAAQPPANVSDRIRLAALALDSDSPPEPELLISAARDALVLGELVLGERLARGAMAMGAGFAAALPLANTLAWQGRGAEAEAVLGPIDTTHLDEFELLLWCMPRAANLFWMLSRPDDAAAVMKSTRARLTQPAALNLVDALEAMFAVYRAQTAWALPRIYETGGAPEALPLAKAWTGASGALAAAYMGRFDEVRPFAEQGLAASAESETGNLRFTIGLGQVYTHSMRGDLEAAETTAREYVDFAELQQPGRSLGGVLLGRVHYLRGDLAAAESEFRQAAAVLEGTGYSWAFLSAAFLCQTLAVAGRAEAAREALVRAERLFGVNTELFRSDLEMTRAWVAAAEADRSRAVAHALAGARAAAKSDLRAQEMLCLYLAVRFGDGGVADRLEQLAAQVAGTLFGAAAVHARALADRDGDRLDVLAGKLESVGALLVAADAAAQAATVHGAAGNRRAELAAAAAAKRLAQRCAGASTPALTAVSNPLPLTGRELEVASMVARGLSNKEIADRLVVSVRTVEGHIYRSCTKLDVPDRTALAAAVRMEGE